MLPRDSNPSGKNLTFFSMHAMAVGGSGWLWQGEGCYEKSSTRKFVDRIFIDLLHKPNIRQPTMWSTPSSFSGPWYTFVQYIFSCISPTGLATCTLILISARQIHVQSLSYFIFCVSYVMREFGYEGSGQTGIFYVSNCWPNLRVHAPQNSGYLLLTSLKPYSLARPNWNLGAACDPLQLANKLERHTN
jgi:hypothetical protein